MQLHDFLIRYYDYRPFGNTFLNKVIGNITKYLEVVANKVLPRYFEKNKILPIELSGKPHIDAIVCLTTFPKRIGYLWFVMECMARQSVLPSKIYLYLAKSQFPDDNCIPKNLIRYVEIGLLEIRIVDEDIRSHKKYWYAFPEFADKDIITIDDDIIYPTHFVESLYQAHSQHPDCVISNYWHPMKWDNIGNVKPYSEWVNLRSSDKNFETGEAFFGSGGGTYFPVGSLLDVNQPFSVIRECCPLADDIWLNAIVRKNGYRLFCLPYKYSLPEWKIKGNETLTSVNNGSNKNDEQLEKVQQTCVRLFGKNPFAKNNFVNK